MSDRTAGLLTGAAAVVLAVVGYQHLQPQPGAPGNPLAPAPAAPVGKVLAFINGDCQQCQRLKDNLGLVKVPVKVEWIDTTRNRPEARRWKVRTPPVWILLDEREREVSRAEGHLSVPELFRWLRVPLPPGVKP